MGNVPIVLGALLLLGFGAAVGARRERMRRGWADVRTEVRKTRTAHREAWAHTRRSLGYGFILVVLLFLLVAWLVGSGGHRPHQPVRPPGVSRTR